MNKSSAITAIKICQPTVITHFYFLGQKDGLKLISQKVDFDHLKILYEGDKELNHNHRCILSILYYGHGKNFDNYIIHLLESLETFHIHKNFVLTRS